ncbi:HAD hydrolase family protein [Planomonospora sp. ID82291]|uniref:HAD hydrolase family protein n=1 Tax=Planomonospora sp. ID82291 TaxID=2738136 RepID=UPI0018C3D1D5|nr:HAD hydrolase family protein [Planomonospora sp. ID82291]MBG0816675.1 HAD hydrolase family protein [Planomonospora sp. ID82291]
MRYHALACDYDETLAAEGRVDDGTVAALERLARSGRRLIMVTGRELEDLRRVFSRLDLFDRVVAENGAVLYRPADQTGAPLAEAPPARLVELLRERGVEPLGVGSVIVSTREPHGDTVLHAIRELGLEMQLIFNKGAVMVLPSGVNKASGLAVALAELGLSAHSTVGVGDAENDHAFLVACECAAAVANALPAVKERCDLVTAGERGAGVAELAGRIVETDLSEVDVDRHHLLLGAVEGGELRFSPYGLRLLVAGPSHSGKSTVTAALLERIAEAGYQFCLIDPEGDYIEGIEGAVVLGDGRRAPTEDEILQVLQEPGESVVVNLLGMSIDDRPGFFEAFLPRLAALRARHGHPHWLVVDEAHHLMPDGFGLESVGLLREAGALLLVTVHPAAVSGPVLQALNAIAAVGESPGDALGTFAAATGQILPPEDLPDLPTGHLLLWQPPAAPLRVELTPPRRERQRHRRKYAIGDLGEAKSFYFRGPHGALNLRAENLAVFCRLADGVDDDTWNHHLRRGDYSRWIAEQVKDEELAAEVARVEREPGDSAAEARRRVRELVEDRYTAAATGPG